MITRWKESRRAASPLEKRAGELFGNLPEPPAVSERQRYAIEERALRGGKRGGSVRVGWRPVSAGALLVAVAAALVVWWQLPSPAQLWEIPEGARTELHGKDGLELAVEGPAQLSFGAGREGKSQRALTLKRGTVTVSSGARPAQVTADGIVVTVPAQGRVKITLEESRMVVAAYTTGVTVGEVAHAETVLTIGREWSSSALVTRPAAGAAPMSPALAMAPVAPMVAPARVVEASATSPHLAPHAAASVAAPVLRRALRSPAPAPATSPRVAESPPADPLDDEAHQLARVMSTLRVSHDAATALTVLDRYEREHPHGALAQEAMRLRVEALLTLGRRQAALDLLERAAPPARGDDLERLREQLRNERTR